MQEFKHIPVLLNETIEALDIKPNGIYIDGTAGGAGHSVEIAKRLDPYQGGRLIALDRDPEAVAAASKRLEGYPAQVIQSDFADMKAVVNDLGIKKVNGVLLDIGVSSHQLDDAERGFSYHTDAPLDMRMSGQGMSAKDVVNSYSYEQLKTILYDYGEEKFAPSIANAIIKARAQKEIETTLELAEIIKSGVPARVKREKNPCKKTFQAIRIEVNDEFGQLDRALDEAFDLLEIGGRLAVITFHSLEDRMVKRRFLSFAQGCTCPPDFPQCVCGKKPRAKIVIKKPITASAEELEQNKRSHSAKLRAVERIDEQSQ
ncbi:MAG: 16S rRNA (cytosine(1402)-N(4))-methyltransferase RsmH [Ruminococcus sp.]|nr:16S rRNA (cytosine(1402)-N(4))-methyltransferase RsmH [Ruminococcus sp.]